MTPPLLPLTLLAACTGAPDHGSPADTDLHDETGATDTAAPSSGRACADVLSLDLPWDDHAPLPVRPHVERLCHDPAQREPGCLLVELTSEAGQGLFVLDEDLQLIRSWSGSVADAHDDGQGALRLVSGGQIATLAADGTLTLLTNEPTRLHHEVHETPSGTLLTLSNHALEVVDPVPATLSDHDILEVDATTGDVLRRVRLSDILPTDRVVWDSLAEAPTGLDWSHPNSIVDRDGGGWLVNLRNQQALVALQPDGTLDWILADPGQWPPELEPLLLEPLGDLRWHYESHAAEWHPGGLVVMFDNHYRGHLPGDPPPVDPVFSRVVAYQVDEAAGTVAQLWELEETTTGPLYARAFGDADLQPQTGNVIAVWGWVSEESGVPYADQGLGVHGARILEYAPDGTIVLDLRLTTDDPALPDGVKVYRVENVPCADG